MLISVWLSLGIAVASAGGDRAGGDRGGGDLDDLSAAGLDLLDAVRLTLVHDPNIALVEVQLESASGALRSSRGIFDPVFSSTVTRSDDDRPTSETDSDETSTLSQRFDLSQLLRTGLSFEPSIDLSRDDGIGPPVNTATVSFAIRQPILRDRGRDVVGAEEQASEREVKAARLDIAHTIATRIAAVASQYWRVRAAALDLEVLRKTEASSRELLETTRRLVEGDITPAAEVVPLEADLASREVSRITGEQTLFATHQALIREIGLGERRRPLALADSALPETALPDTAFPTLTTEAVPPTEPTLVDEVRDGALLRRADLAAARSRLDAAQIRAAAARNALKPRLDLILGTSYAGFVEGSDASDVYAPLVENVPGFSTQLGFSLSWPTRNRRAEGALMQADAATRSNELLVALSANEIGASVPIALDAVRRSAEQLERLETAVALFEQALDNEIKKLRAGTSTVVDVITQRDRLTAVERQRITARLALALAIVDLRFQTGTLYRSDADRGAVSYENLTTLPF